MSCLFARHQGAVPSSDCPHCFFNSFIPAIRTLIST